MFELTGFCFVLYAYGSCSSYSRYKNPIALPDNSNYQMIFFVSVVPLALRMRMMFMPFCGYDSFIPLGEKYSVEIISDSA